VEEYQDKDRAKMKKTYSRDVQLDIGVTNRMRVLLDIQSTHAQLDTITLE